MGTFVLIDGQAYDTNTAEEIAEAAALLHAEGIAEADVWAGDPEGEHQRNGQKVFARGKILRGKPVHGDDGWIHETWLGNEREGICQKCGRSPSDHRVEGDGRGTRHAVCVSEPLRGWVRPGFVRYDVPGLGAVQYGVVRNSGRVAEELGTYSVVNGFGDYVHEIRKDGSARYDYDNAYIVPRDVLAAACELANAPLEKVLASVA